MINVIFLSFSSFYVCQKSIPCFDIDLAQFFLLPPFLPVRRKCGVMNAIKINFLQSVVFLSRPALGTHDDVTTSFVLEFVPLHWHSFWLFLTFYHRVYVLSDNVNLGTTFGVEFNHCSVWIAIVAFMETRRGCSWIVITVSSRLNCLRWIYCVFSCEHHLNVGETLCINLCRAFVQESQWSFAKKWFLSSWILFSVEAKFFPVWVNVLQIELTFFR